ncbi:glycosyltransferase family 2 protein [Saliphagus infecundisoli]|uniref:Glycosyltransferase family 2 protein n=1 Tax=Saliphagus infecundisoli TaxID=1849069 RepID=A0ABD5QIR9_9EURY|nr:glycosyltransferase family 2 protein [Saliphagus infecundisoli]
MTIDGVSVIIPTYDDISYLGQALDSIIEQSVDSIEVEIILVDSSSTEIAERIANSYGTNVRYDWMPPEGVAAARNRGIERATHEVIGFCDADDYWHEDKLRYQLPRIEAGYDIVYSGEYLLTDGAAFRLSSLSIKNSDNQHINHFRNGGIGSRSVLVRRKCLDDQRFDERFTVREDPHLWTRLLAEYSVSRVPRPLSYKRRRSDSLTADRDLGFRMEMMEIKDLVDRYPELKPYRSEREVRAKLQYAKTLISDENRSRDAQRVLLDLLQQKHYSPRLVFLSLISLLPIMNKQVIRLLQEIQWKITN